MSLYVFSTDLYVIISVWCNLQIAVTALILKLIFGWLQAYFSSKKNNNQKTKNRLLYLEVSTECFPLMNRMFQKKLQLRPSRANIRRRMSEKADLWTLGSFVFFSLKSPTEISLYQYCINWQVQIRLHITGTSLNKVLRQILPDMPHEYEPDTTDKMIYWS